MTPHINAKKGEIAKSVIMPGDPKRAKIIAEKFLKFPRLVSDVRGILAYTGIYEGKEVTVMASGMGMPSMGIYATELFRFYDVEKIIRVGTCGALSTSVKLEDIILVNDAYTTSNFAHSLTGIDKHLEYASQELNELILKNALALDIIVNEATINTSDIFYTEYADPFIKMHNPIAVEMETFALLFIANHFEKQAASILTVSDNVVTKEELSSDEREKKLDNAIILALKSL